jgi:hypothetical protein
MIPIITPGTAADKPNKLPINAAKPLPKSLPPIVLPTNAPPAAPKIIPTITENKITIIDIFLSEPPRVSGRVSVNKKSNDN